MRPLTSERDQNFHVCGVDGAEYVLKIANAAEDERIIAFQNHVLEHLERVDPALRTPRVIPDKRGQPQFVERGSFVRMLSWIDGVLMHQVERTETLRTSLGRLHGRLARALGTCVAAPPAAQDLLWDLLRLRQLRPLLDHMEIHAERRMLQGVLDRFDAEAAPELARLPAQIIHNDLNPHNVVVDAAGCASGVIDFGDMVCAPVICDVAVAGAYHVRSGCEPLSDVSQYVAAFHEERPLSAAEIELLPLLIQARLAMTVLITNWRASLHPQNRAYILRNAPAAWAGLAALAASPARLEVVV